MTRKRKRAQVSESSHASDGQLETSGKSTEPTITPEVTSPQYLYEEPSTPQEPKHIPWLCEEREEIVYKETLRTNNDVFTTLSDSTAQIRLLRLDAESTENHIKAYLSTWERSSLPDFNAISYVCGQAFPHNAVYINGHEFYVGDNCFYALKQVCLHYPGSYVWIDAICINQQDLEEKSAQVSAMGGIYRSALRVLACIGPSDAVSDEIVRATQDLDSFIQEPPPEWDEPDAYRRPCLWKPPLWNPPMDESATLKFWETFTKFELRPYFNRAWIVQELNGGHGRTTILCGQSKIDWSALCTLADRLWVISESLHAPYDLQAIRGTDHTISDFDRLVTIFQDPEHPFPSYLMIMMDKDCQDPRDRFYGTLDLVDWQRFGQKRPVPDYHITPLQLAFNLLQMTVDPGFNDVYYIAQSLGLHSNSQLLSDIDRERASRDARCNARRRYGLKLGGIHKIEQRTDGRLSVELHHNSDSRYSHSVPVPEYFDGQEYNPTSLAANGLLQLYTGEKPSVLATAVVQAGDLLVHGHETVLLLRHEEDRARLSVIGGALLAAKFTSRDALEPPTGCICWQTVPKARAGHALLKLRFELPDTVALESAIAQPDESYDADLILPYVSRHAFGTTMAHSGLGSPPTSHKKGKYTLRHAPTGRSLRKPCANCKRTGNPFWYLLSPDQEGVVDFAH